MPVPEPLKKLIRYFEGLRLKVYRCPAGIPTQGYGHTGADVKMGNPPITEAKAEEWLDRDAERFLLEAIKLSPYLALPWHSNRLCAIADFCYNLGSSRYKASTLRRRMNECDWDGAAEEIQKWVWGGGKKLPGLVKRRKAEAELLVD